MSILITVLVVATVILAIFALADFPAGSRVAFLCAAVLILALVVGILALGGKTAVAVVQMLM